MVWLCSDGGSHIYDDISELTGLYRNYTKSLLTMSLELLKILKLFWKWKIKSGN